MKEYGMSERLGAVAYEPERRPLFLPGGNGLSGGTQYSEATAREIDEEVKGIVDETETRVQDLLTKRKGQLQVLAERLLHKEVLEGEELRALLDGNRAVGERGA